MYTHPDIDGWMTSDELQWLFDRSQEMKGIVEIGSFNGRSTHALLSGGAQVVAVDHFRGSAGEEAHAGASQDDGIYRDFQRNVGHFPNLSVVRMPSLEAAAMFKDRTFDAVFIDASHEYENVRADILAWGPKARKLLCGHDYHESWPGVIKAVRELLVPFEVHGTIWSYRLTR